MKKTTYVLICALSLGSTLMTKNSFATEGEVEKTGRSLQVAAEAYYEVLTQERTRIVNDPATQACLKGSGAYFFSDPCPVALGSIRAYANIFEKALRVMAEKTDAFLVATVSLRRVIYRADPTSPLLSNFDEAKIQTQLNFFRDEADLADFVIDESSRISKNRDAQQSEVANWTRGVNSELVARDLEYIKSFVKTSQ